MELLLKDHKRLTTAKASFVSLFIDCYTMSHPHLSQGALFLSDLALRTGRFCPWLFSDSSLLEQQFCLGLILPSSECDNVQTHFWLTQLIGVVVLLASSGQKPRSLLNILKCTEHLLLQIHHIIPPRKELTSSKCQQCGGRESCTPLNGINLVWLQHLHRIFMFYFVQLCLLPCTGSLYDTYGMALHLSALLHYSAVDLENLFSSLLQPCNL